TPDAPWMKQDEDISKGVESDTQWDHEFSGKVIKLLPEKLLHDTSQTYILNFFESCLEWTIEKQEPSWLEENQRFEDKDIIYEWNHSVSSTLARVVGIFPTEEIKAQFLMPILKLKTDACWELLYPFIENYICSYIYDAQNIPDNALDVLDLCLDRFFKASCFDKKGYKAGEISGFDLPKIS